MKKIWRWIIGAVIVLVILGFLGVGGSNRAAYRSARGVENNEWLNINWRWVTLIDHSKPTKSTIVNPNAYTILFKEDGTFEGKADCNNFSGTYTQENGVFTIEIGPSTRAFCGELSLDQDFLKYLSDTGSGGPDGKGGFALVTTNGVFESQFEE